MKIDHLIFQFVFLLMAVTTFGQGTFIYDQQSSDESTVLPGSVNINIFSGPGQSFTPSLSAVGFIRLFIIDDNTQDALGATLLINLRSNSISGPIMASTAPVAVANGAAQAVSFFFNNAVPVTPNTTYYFDIVQQSGVTESWDANESFYNYGGGTLFVFGDPDPSSRDMWFREGIYVVPEPSSVSLVLV